MTDARRVSDAFRIGGDVALLVDRFSRVRRVIGGNDGGNLDGWLAAMVGRLVVEAWGESAQGAVLEVVAQARQGRPASCVQPCEWTNRDPRRFFRVSALRTDADEDEPDVVMLVCRDVSALQRQHEQLDWLVGHTQGIISATEELVWHADAAQRIGRRFSNVADHASQPSWAREEWPAAIHPDDRERADDRSREAVQARRGYSTTYRFRSRSAEYRWVEDHAVPVRDREGHITAWVGVITDIHDRVLVQDALRISEERLRLAVDAAQVGVWDVNLATGQRQWSDGLKALFGLPPDAEPSETLLFSLVHPGDRLDVWLAHRDCFETIAEIAFRINRLDTGEERWLLSKGQAVVDDGGLLSRRLGTMQDITERKRAERKLWLAANEDHLTALPNRGFFTQRLAETIAAAAGSRSRVGLLLVDLDHFKTVNDTLGHDAGDVVLRLAADRLRATCPENAVVARLGGDEFAILIPGAVDAELTSLAEAVVRTLTAPMSHRGAEIRCSASVGVASAAGPETDGARLLKHADLALYAAKKAGRDRHAIFDPAMGCVAQRRVAVVTEARRALARGEIVPFYQPKIDPRTGHVLGFEALLRWRHALGLRLPATLADAFADKTLSPMIGQAMFSQVADDLSRWQVTGVDVGHVAINVAAAEFASGTLPDRWVDGLRTRRLPHAMLQIEVTEQTFLDGDSEDITRMLGDLHDAGIAVALDDFGSGSMSLGHLSRLPIDWVKIDPCLVSSAPEGGRTGALVKAVIELAHAFDLGVVAEAVETEAQIRAVCERGCDLIQGFAVAPPMPAVQVPAFLADWADRRRRPPARRTHRAG